MYCHLPQTGTFFLRAGLLAVLFSACHRHAEIPARTQPASRADTVIVTVPVLRFTPADPANSSAQLDSAVLELIERRVMSRLASLQRAEAQHAAGVKTAGVTPVKNAAAEIRQGLLGRISFSNDGNLDRTSQERIAAIAELLNELQGALEIRAVASANMSSIDVAIARARRVYLELIGRNESLAERDVAITVSAHAAATLGSNLHVEIFWRGTQ
jgi:hypothetical protein